LKKLCVVRHDRISEWDITTYSGVANDDIEVIACGTKEVNVPNVTSFVYTFPHEVMELTPDIIDVADPHYEWAQYFCARHDRVVISAWDNLLGKNHDIKSKTAMKQAWKFVARTGMIKQALIWDGVSAEKIEIIPAAIDCDAFKPKPYEEREDAVLFCGRIVPEKGLKDLIWAMKDIPAELWVVGEATEQNKDFYNGWAFKAGVRMRWLGFLDRDSFAATMAMAKVFSCPSYPLGSEDPFGEWLEQFGQVFIEALACGTPVITTDCGGASEIIESGYTGVLVPARHWHFLHGQIANAVRGKSYWRGYSQGARIEAERRFSTYVVGTQIRKWYFE
jgi:glycosyltransferase involved in cell wall biosynthesis